MKINKKNIQDIIKCIGPIRENNFDFNALFEKPKDLTTNTNNTGKFYDIELKKEIEILGKKFRNAIFYPPSGGMGWHTNGPENGRRVYISWSETGESGMNWYDLDKDVIKIDQDEAGFNIRIFEIPQWHCVWAKCNRFSIGFDIE